MRRAIRHITTLVPAALFLAACASGPIIDTYNVDMVQYEKDLAQCEEIAEQVEAGTVTAKSAAFGAGVGAAQGAIWGDVGRSSASGAVTGGAGGILKADNEKAQVTKNCLRYRGYAVLN
ncbi:MAG: glycine zipper family protein [Xanthomonadales bacterium]|nr:glycine zipper family protein [Gammaproteobacteria bacterium]MBT8064133.1 glycine zipper family protein [Gammaproteobacteria bacterium]NNJ65369.1 glycine zipper family protein [Xanthomonadales bacterium]NNK33432.1 glycine zipper family protein [Xanthomonadales bacterium]NNK37227.1 glycine zipper family protein [Xanthomonadales bacterium]